MPRWSHWPHGFYGKPSPQKSWISLSLSLYCTQGFIETSQTLKIRKRKRERERERTGDSKYRYYLVSLIIIVIPGCLIFWKPTYFGCHHSLCQKCGFQICLLLEHTGLSVSRKTYPPSPATTDMAAGVPQSILHFEARIPQILHGSPIWRFVPAANPTFYGHVFVGPLLDESKPQQVHTAGKEISVKFRVGQASLQSDQFENLDCCLVVFLRGGGPCLRFPNVPSMCIDVFPDQMLAEVDYIRWRHLDLERPHPVWFKLDHEGQERAPTKIVRIGDFYFPTVNPQVFFCMTQWMGNGLQSGRNIRFPTKKPGITRPCSISPWPMISTSPGGRDYHCVWMRLD